MGISRDEDKRRQDVQEVHVCVSERKRDLAPRNRDKTSLLMNPALNFCLTAEAVQIGY